MQLQNIINLESGLNIIEITSDDLGLVSSKIPIAIIPKGQQVKNISIFGIEPFKSANVPNQINADSCIKARLQVGDNSTNDLFLSTTEINSTGTVAVNTGEYFDDPVSYETDNKIYLETWLMPRVWTIGGNLNTARFGLAGCGTQNAGLSFGGYNGSNTGATEEYNGASWSAGGSLSTARRYLAGAGTQIAGLSFGGYAATDSPVTESYNGTSWTGASSCNIAYYGPAGCGSQNNALKFGGAGYITITEYFNGSSWVYEGHLNVGRSVPSACGTRDAALCFGGSNGSRLNITEEYNGSSWSVSNNSIVERQSGAGFGSQNAGVSVGGNDNNGNELNIVEEYDGINWSLSNVSNYNKDYLTAAGNSGNGLSIGGSYLGAYLSSTEEYTGVNVSQVTPSGNLTLNITIS